MMNINKTTAIIILVIFSFVLWAILVTISQSATKEIPEKIYADENAAWIYEGTFCSECQILYNYKEYPEICDKCDTQTKDFFYLALLKDRK